MKILTFSSLYPNSVHPQHGIFVETRLRKLVESGEIMAGVVAPVPWFPITVGPFSRYAATKDIPEVETLKGIDVRHPRYLAIPKIGMRFTPGNMVRAAGPIVQEMIASGDVDLIDAHYFYPDGVAAAMLAKEFDIPCVITGRGSDLNLFPEFPLARKRILEAVDIAATCITVSEALQTRLIEIGAPADRVVTLRNGVDTDLFAPVDPDAAKRRLGLNGRIIVSVGNLAPEKGQNLLVEALRTLANATLVLVGDGPEKSTLRQIAARCGVEDRVIFAGRIPQADLPAYYSAADVSVLASIREGWPNVLLESMACGTRVVATRVGGVPEIIAAPEAGKMVEDRKPEALAETIGQVLAQPADRPATRAYAEKFSWEETTQGQIDLFRRIVGS